MTSNSGYPFQPLNAVIHVNELQPRRAIQRLKAEFDGLKGRRIALLGMAFKPGTDDMREAPSAIIASASSPRAPPSPAGTRWRRTPTTGGNRGRRPPADRTPSAR
ncbi:hypothetical protein QMZ92_17605 [Streptomyces sp. HNM0645]|uniref:hypothetical protein n=1 Tax=Streptomyces sp. HNM0645 TaxID=2782343 RepID=UPI0024B66CA2|nr:hypothetical protein [Streptomyces sp. HNM0645]MDI9886146.1 hypothetical protein [Streptomyces sp. HNM0645]